HIVQQNSSLVGDLTAVAQDLGQESGSMADTIGVFRTPEKRAAALPVRRLVPNGNLLAAPVAQLQ
ncbi:chemotaxis protein, partial [Bordetella hinzii]|nr:chemotaxis protein [Bordetella hinzii]